MNRFLTELKLLWFEVTHGYPSQKDMEHYRRRMRFIMSLEIEACTPEQIVAAVLAFKPHIPWSHFLYICYQLNQRRGRGKVTLDQVGRMWTASCEYEDGMMP